MFYMKTFFFLFILFLFSFPLYSEVNNEDQFIETGKLLYKKNEIGITLFTGEYYEKDEYGHWETTKYVNGRKHGPYKSYYNSGIIEAEGNYKNGNMDVLWKWYHYFTGVITDSVNYKIGVRHGLKHIYWGPDQIMTYENYNNGKLDGEWLSYYENGQLKFKENYKDGKKEGLFEFFNIEGNVVITETYKNGERID